MRCYGLVFTLYSFDKNCFTPAVVFFSSGLSLSLMLIIFKNLFLSSYQFHFQNAVLMLFREIITVYSESLTKHTGALYRHNAEIVSIKQVP